ncbi:hypothetical protein ABH920_005687 [Catenulispora sp. EB89]|uniref:hypothetical protein n=1 Tax=Catenulispora sp. EB89 TaxID=3156257 RepID=UPI003515BF37
MRTMAREHDQGVEIEPVYDIILRSMNENPLTHNPLKHDGAAGRQKSLLITSAIVLGVIAVAAIAFSVYAWQQNRQLSSDVTAKNNQIAELQKQAAPAKTTPTTTPTTDPYAGWQSATLKYEKASFKYPSTWTLTNSSTPGGTADIPATPGIDYAKLVSPTGLTLSIDTGDGGANGGAYFGTVLSATPISTLGGNYYLGFGSGGASGSNVTAAGSVGTAPTSSAALPPSKNVTDKSGAPLYDVISMLYSSASGTPTSKPVSAFQSDASYNDALLIIKSLSY